MKLRKILLGLTLAGSLISYQAFALTPAEEVAQAKAAADARWWANYNATLAEQARQYQLVYGKPLDGSTSAVTATPVTTPAVVTAPTVIAPAVVTRPTVATPVASPGIDISTFATAEYTANGISAGKSNDDYLRVINASSAWSRGYTGLGSKILIIDSGINANHSEFLNSITDTKDFVRSKFGITDNVGHGTSMASIAAANWNGTGVAGVAPDADLAIAKVTDNKSYGFTQARQAIAWGTTIGADVANISANTMYDNTSRRTFYQLADGSWANSGAAYKTNYYTGGRATGFYLNEDPKAWASALGTSEMVIVNSAGNSGLRYPENPAPMAYATRPDGTLYLNGQMLVVGAYDINTNSIASYSNQAGHLCQGFNISAGTCNDKYRMSDFYILAPGNAFSASKTGTDVYNISTGTSEAAAVVSGAVAIVHQQWPQMTGANIVKLLTATANKDLVNYDKNVMGAGLLDLEKATRPYGVVGIPTDGRNGVKTSLGGGFSTSTSGGLATLSSLSNVMVTDEFGRDYYVNMASTANTKRATGTFNPISKANFYEDYNPYNKLNYYTNGGKVALGQYDVRMSMNEFTQTGLVESGYTTKFNDKANYRLGVGMLNERNAWMGNQISGMMGEVGGSYTQFINFTGAYNLNKNLSLFGSAWMGFTQANLQTSGLITNVGATQSYSWSMGVDYTKEKHSFGTTISQPVTVSKGTVDVSVPIGWTANGDVAYDRSRVNISPTAMQYDMGVYYKYKTKNLNLITYGEHQTNYLNQAGVTNQQFGFAFNKEF
jgi:subtilisin family serine protease